jgi:hypothetical protein
MRKTAFKEMNRFARRFSATSWRQWRGCTRKVLAIST